MSKHRARRSGQASRRVGGILLGAAALSAVGTTPAFAWDDVTPPPLTGPGLSGVPKEMRPCTAQGIGDQMMADPSATAADAMWRSYVGCYTASVQ